MRRILVPIDTSQVSESIVEAAGSIAADMNGEVTILFVAPRQPDRFGQQLVRKVIEEPVPENLRKEFDALQALGKRVRDLGVKCETLMVRGTPVNTILRERDRLGIDIIVMGSHGRGALYRNLVGSVSEGILRAGPCPLLIIPSRSLSNDR